MNDNNSIYYTKIQMYKYLFVKILHIISIKYRLKYKTVSISLNHKFVINLIHNILTNIPIKF